MTGARTSSYRNRKRPGLHTAHKENPLLFIVLIVIALGESLAQLSLMAQARAIMLSTQS